MGPGHVEAGRAPVGLAANPVTPASWSESWQVIHPATSAAAPAMNGANSMTASECGSSRLPKIVNGQASQPSTQAVWQRSASGQAPTAASTSSEVAKLVLMLRNSEMPSQREFAAEALATFPWWVHAEVLPALATAAVHDPAAVVRAACIRCLRRTDLRDPRVTEALGTLRGDSDVRVRTEAEAAVAQAARVTAGSRSLDAPGVGRAEMLPR
jgi:hypothetical protein